MSLEIDGRSRPDVRNEPQGCSDDFLQQHADTNRKSLASWYNSEYLPANKYDMSRQTKSEMDSILRLVLGQHPITRRSLGSESLAIVSEWENLPLIPGTAEFGHARTLASLQFAPDELNKARVWLYEWTQGDVVEHFPYKRPFYYKELNTDGQTTSEPWKHAQYVEPEQGAQSVSGLKRLSRHVFRDLTASARQPKQVKHSLRHHPYARPGIMGSTARYHGEQGSLGASSSSNRDRHASATAATYAYDDDSDSNLGVPLPTGTRTTSTTGQPASGLAEEQAVEDTSQTLPDHSHRLNSNHIDYSASSDDTHDAEQLEQAFAPPAYSAHASHMTTITEESDGMREIMTDMRETPTRMRKNLPSMG
ncbi:MAG: hypothetical protein Q9226_002873 [Calogaya cf. arnoldii]